MLLVEYDVVTKVTDAEEEYILEDLADHKLVCYYVMNDSFVEEKMPSLKNHT